MFMFAWKWTLGIILLIMLQNTSGLPLPIVPNSEIQKSIEELWFDENEIKESDVQEMSVSETPLCDTKSNKKDTKTQKIDKGKNNILYRKKQENNETRFANKEYHIVNNSSEAKNTFLIKKIDDVIDPIINKTLIVYHSLIEDNGLVHDRIHTNHGKALDKSIEDHKDTDSQPHIRKFKIKKNPLMVLFAYSYEICIVVILLVFIFFLVFCCFIKYQIIAERQHFQNQFERYDNNCGEFNNDFCLKISPKNCPHSESGNQHYERKTTEIRNFFFRKSFPKEKSKLVSEKSISFKHCYGSNEIAVSTDNNMPFDASKIFEYIRDSETPKRYKHMNMPKNKKGHWTSEKKDTEMSITKYNQCLKKNNQTAARKFKSCGMTTCHSHKDKTVVKPKSKTHEKVLMQDLTCEHGTRKKAQKVGRKKTKSLKKLNDDYVYLIEKELRNINFDQEIPKRKHSHFVNKIKTIFCK